MVTSETVIKDFGGVELHVDQNAGVSLVNHGRAVGSTFLNAQLLAPQAVRDVRDGDVIKICDQRFRFEAASVAPSAKRARVADDDDGGDALLSGAADHKPPPTAVARASSSPRWARTATTGGRR